jgi:hypothetical protein
MAPTSICTRFFLDPSLERMGNFWFLQSTLILGSLLIAIQILDGFLTYLGVSFVGLASEGNLILRHLMGLYGPAPTILVAKVSGIILGIFLARQARSCVSIQLVIGLVIAYYTARALIPWTVVLYARGANITRVLEVISL